MLGHIVSDSVAQQYNDSRATQLFNTQYETIDLVKVC